MNYWLKKRVTRRFLREADECAKAWERIGFVIPTVTEPGRHWLDGQRLTQNYEKKKV